MPKDRKMDQMSIKIYQHLPLQDPPKFTRIWIFGLKTCHLATPDFMSADHQDLLDRQADATRARDAKQS
jgi:hypothetical protein